MRFPWIKIAALFLAIWLIAGGAIFFARRAKPTPESVKQYLAKHPMDAASPRERGKIIETVAEDLNQLAYEQRREVRMGRDLDGFFRALQPAEQTRFLDLTLPTGFKQMMEALNKMEPVKRKQFVTKALEDMKKREEDEPPEERQKMDGNAQKIIDQGFRSFYKDASAEVKMDVAPLIEQLQKNLQGAR